MRVDHELNEIRRGEQCGVMRCENKMDCMAGSQVAVYTIVT
jgi:hypothetical protein